MAYVPTNAAIEIQKQIAAMLASNGVTQLQKLINNDPTPPTGMSQAQWDALRAQSAAVLANQQASIDGWLPTAIKPQATQFNQGTLSIASGSPWTTIASWTVTPSCPRDWLVLSSAAGMVTGATGTVGVQLIHGANVLSSVNCNIDAGSIHFPLPLLQATLPASQIPYPLAAITLEYQVLVSVPSMTFVSDVKCPASFSIS